MPFTLIKGTFHAKGYAPDGDSLRFKAANAANWKKLAGPKVERNAKGHAQLRFEGVDALETHYNAGGTRHQPEDLGNAATDFTLKAAGITGVVWGPTHYRVTAANDNTAGYILARTAERYRRPVAFVFAGATNKQDGSSVYLEVPLLRQSINYKLLQKGMAYPTYYEGLFHDLRSAMTDAAISAWNAGRGVWPYDWTGGAPVTGWPALEHYYPMFPKLFRRLAAYLNDHGNVYGFKAHMAQNPERVLVLSTGHFTNFDTVIRQQGQTVGLTVYPEDLVFRG